MLQSVAGIGARLLLGLAALGLLLPQQAALANDRHAAMVIDANTGAVLHADRADEARYPASLTKMMTLYMAFEAIEQGRLNYSTRLKVSQEAAAAGAVPTVSLVGLTGSPPCR